MTNYPANRGFAITPSDTVSIKDDPNNVYGLSEVYLHNVSAGATVRVLPASAAVIQGVTLTGSSGTANVTVNGVNYLATFSSALATTAANFVTAHQAALARLNIKVTNVGAQLRFTGSATVSVTNLTGDLAGTALAATPITIYIPQGGTSLISVKQVFNTTPTPPANLVGFN